MTTKKQALKWFNTPGFNFSDNNYAIIRKWYQKKQFDLIKLVAPHPSLKTPLNLKLDILKIILQALGTKSSLPALSIPDIAKKLEIIYHQLENKKCSCFIGMELSNYRFRKYTFDSDWEESWDILTESIMRDVIPSTDCDVLCGGISKTLPTDLLWYDKVRKHTEKYYDTFSGYKSYRYTSINDGLRMNPDREHRYGFNAIIDENAPLEKDIYVFRLVGLKMRSLREKYENIGVPFTSLGYMSTGLLGSKFYKNKCKLIYGDSSISDGVGDEDYESRTLIRIKIPKGKKAYWFLDYGSENEVLFKHGERLVTREYKKVKIVCKKGKDVFSYKEIEFYDLEML